MIRVKVIRSTTVSNQFPATKQLQISRAIRAMFLRRTAMRLQAEMILPNLRTEQEMAHPVKLERMAVCRWTEAIPPKIQVVRNPTAPSRARRLRRNLPAMGRMMAKASVRNRISSQLPDLKTLRPKTLERMAICRRTGAIPPRFQMVWNPNALRTLSRARMLKRNRAAMGRMMAKASVRNRISPRLPDLKTLRRMTPERMAACRRTEAIPPGFQMAWNPTAPALP